MIPARGRIAPAAERNVRRSCFRTRSLTSDTGTSTSNQLREGRSAFGISQAYRASIVGLTAWSRDRLGLLEPEGGEDGQALREAHRTARQRRRWASAGDLGRGARSGRRRFPAGGRGGLPAVRVVQLLEGHERDELHG